ncbi:MAG: hypothetical protein AB7S75_01500 [Desulfococcaceae bacterium]
MNRKVILYSHFGGLGKYRQNPSSLGSSNYLQRFEEMIQVNVDSLADVNDYTIASVYIFVDISTYSIVKENKGKLSESEVKEALRNEREIIAGLEKIEQQARKNVDNTLINPNFSTQYMIGNYPKFIYIGINHLSVLLNELESIEPELIQFVGSRAGTNFTYDTPKFVESIIRIARNNIKIPCTEEVILRIDEDVTVYYDGIKTLLNRYSQFTKKPFHYFSGTYGKYNSGNPTDDHPKNNYAVRVHFFVNPNTQNSAPALSTFLSDLAELGATQENFQKNHSENLQYLVIKGKHKKNETRRFSEIISGAGLIASPLVIRYLPPFMCFDMPVTWIDDHLKRRLLEVIEFISRNDIESVQDAKFTKNRHTQPITEKDILGAPGYLKILLSGCMFHSLITDDNERPTEYSDKIKEIIRKKKLSFNNIPNFKGKIKEILATKYEKVIECWTSDEYKDSPAPNLDVFYKWAKTEKEKKENKWKLVDGLTEDAMRYLELMSRWDIFVSAIDRL